MSVIINGLSKIYGTQKAVDQISFEARPGEIIGFLGPNGAGKSTTMKMITGYVPPNEGSVNVCGVNAVKNSLKTRGMIGYLPENNPLYTDMYVHEYLLFIASLHRLTDKKRKAAEMVEITGLQAEQKKKIGTLSKGYRQRVGLAAALIHNPPVLILDEPTTGLDPNQIIEIRALIKNTGKEKTIIFSSHLMQEVEAVCDRVLIINKGKLVANNTLAQLQNLKGSQTTIVAEFKSAVDEKLLASIQGVDKIIIGPEGTYKIICDGKNDIRGEIFNLSANQQWNLLGLRLEENSLENIFRELTK